MSPKIFDLDKMSYSNLGTFSLGWGDRVSVRSKKVTWNLQLILQEWFGNRMTIEVRGNLSWPGNLRPRAIQLIGTR